MRLARELAPEGNALFLEQLLLCTEGDGGGVPYAGAVILGILARVTADSAERRDRIARGERLLTRGTMSHNVLQFHQCAIEAWLEERNWGRVEQHTQALADYTREEPLPWSDFFLRRRRALAAAAEAAGM
jgi:predicted transcriptional regulator